MFIVCKNCKRVIISWPDSDTMMTRHCSRGIDWLACSLCFGGCKIVAGDPPDICAHGRPKDMRCYECRKEEQYPDY